MKLKNTSPKKVDTVDDVILTIEFQLKKIAQKTKLYQEQIEILTKSVAAIEEAVIKGNGVKASELYKEFSDANTLVAKMSKELETIHKRFHKIQAEYDKKLADPLASGKLSNLKQTIIDDIKSNSEKIAALLVQTRKPLDEIVNSVQGFAKRLAAVEQQVLNLCLPEQLEEINKMSEKFNKYAEMLCKETASLTISAKPNGTDPHKITAALMFLSKAHQKGGQLLEQVHKNLAPMNVAAAAATAITAAAAAINDSKANPPAAK